MTRTRSDSGGQAPKRKSPVALIVLILGGIAMGAVLLCGCGVGIWVVWLASLNVTPEKWNQRVKEQAEERWKIEEQQATSDQYRAKAFLEYWLLLLEMKNLDEPYRLASKAFQERLSRQQFDDFIKDRPHLRASEQAWTHGLDGKPGDRFGFMLHKKKPGDRVFTNSMLWAVREGNEWRLDKLEDIPNR
jgi:hypothetical protein